MRKVIEILLTILLIYLIIGFGIALFLSLSLGFSHLWWILLSWVFLTYLAWKE